MLEDDQLAAGHATGWSGGRLVMLKGVFQRFPEQFQVLVAKPGAFLRVYQSNAQCQVYRLFTHLQLRTSLLWELSGLRHS